MVLIKVNGQQLDVDIRTELEAFEWTRPTWSNDKLIAASPFRYDRSPSFFVTIEGEYAGAWGDSGAYDSEYASGGFVKLLAFLRDETWEETEEYLQLTYGMSTGKLTLKVPQLTFKRPRVYLSEELLESYEPAPTEYLTGRCISERVQRGMGVHYDRNRQAVVIPWREPGGKLANVKYRKTRGKVFWYEKGAVPIRELVFGLDIVYKARLKRAVIAEAEIDALSVATGAGVAGLALGGSTFTDKQADAIKRSPLEEVIVWTDADKAGEKLRREINRKLRGYVRIKNARGADGMKDINEVLKRSGDEEVRRCILKAEDVRSFPYFRLGGS
jgi:5S rRNA maturation endonuclease (ribonuclease M5)